MSEREKPPLTLQQRTSRRPARKGRERAPSFARRHATRLDWPTPRHASPRAGPPRLGRVGCFTRVETPGARPISGASLGARTGACPSPPARRREGPNRRLAGRANRYRLHRLDANGRDPADTRARSLLAPRSARPPARHLHVPGPRHRRRTPAPPSPREARDDRPSSRHPPQTPCS